MSFHERLWDRMNNFVNANSDATREFLGYSPENLQLSASTVHSIK